MVECLLEGAILLIAYQSCAFIQKSRTSFTLPYPGKISFSHARRMSAGGFRTVFSGTTGCM
ncbi:MAG: hypothetical protein GX876_02540 [Bacteroidales bacterium]|nr:hypothetical protein [Bacteroidales bacterium]